jgi:hypothetical protein
LSGLPLSTTGTTFHLRLTAENGGGTDSKDALDTFTTLPSREPSSQVNPVAPVDVGYTTAHVSGSVDLGEPEHFVTFGWQTSTEPDVPESWHGGICCDTGPSNSEHSFDLTGLNPGTKYYVRIVASDITEGITRYSPEPYESFTTEGTSAPPIATLDPVTIFTGTSAHFSGTVDANAPVGVLPADAKAAYETVWHIECTPECNDPGGNEIAGTVEAGAGAQPISVDATGLEPDTDYTVTLVAENQLKTVESVKVFHSQAVAPSVESTPGGSDGTGGYTLQGVVNPNKHAITDCEFKWGPTAPNYAFGADCSPAPGGGSKPVTVEAHLTGLNPDAHYHALLVIKYGADVEAHGVDQEFIPVLDAGGPPCPNEVLREESNSLTLPECRAYEMVSPTAKDGYGATMDTYSDDGAVLYTSGAKNIANSGSGMPLSHYTATRTDSGWQTIPNLNGLDGSHFAGIANGLQGIGSVSFSADLRSSLVTGQNYNDPAYNTENGYSIQLRRPDGTFAGLGDKPTMPHSTLSGASADLSHVVFNVPSGRLSEYVGTDTAPRPVDIDDSGTPISDCLRGSNDNRLFAGTDSVSDDGSVIYFTATGALGADCGAGPHPPADAIWARVNGASSYEASASHCARPLADLNGACNGPANAVFQGASADGSRAFFTTTQQLLDGDTDQTNDLYAYRLPTASHPDPSLTEISGAGSKADVESVLAVSEDGSTVYFVAKGSLAGNEDALGDEAVAGGHNLYVWSTDSAHPGGQMTYVARLTDLSAQAQTTSDGRYLVVSTKTPLVAVDTDTSRDLYRYDDQTGGTIRLSASVLGVGGNGPFDVSTAGEGVHPFEHQTSHSVSEDGNAIVFSTAEPLSPLDGNGAYDVYLWSTGRVFLISAGSAGGEARSTGVSASGSDVYFTTDQALLPQDGDRSSDVYDARIGGGFSAISKACLGEECQGPAPEPPIPAKPSTNGPPGNGNPRPVLRCPKGKVKRHGRCVRKHPRKHHRNRAAHKNGGGK